MTAPIYGDVNSVKMYRNTEQIPNLMAQTTYLVSSITSATKASTITQLDNIRHQISVIAGIDKNFRPYEAGSAERKMRSVARLTKEGTLEFVAPDQK